MIWLVHHRLPDQEIVGVWHEDRVAYLPGQEKQQERAEVDMSYRLDHIEWADWVDSTTYLTPSWAFWGAFEAPDDLTAPEVLELVRGVR